MKKRTILVEENANNITKGIVNYINSQSDAWASRIHGGGIYKGKGQYRKSTQQPGIYDVAAIYKGRSIWIEVKFGEDKIRPDQVKFAKQVQAAGAHCMIVRTYLEFLNDWEALTKIIEP